MSFGPTTNDNILWNVLSGQPYQKPEYQEYQQPFGAMNNWHHGLGGLFGFDTKNDSDFVQGVKGFMTGMNRGGLAGGLLGLGTSFLDDIGVIK